MYIRGIVMSKPIKISASCWNYGGSLTTGGFEVSKNIDGINNTLYAGFGINKDFNNTKIGGVFDYRANAPVGNIGNVNVSTGVRVRTKVFGGTFNTETRAQLNFGGNIYKNLGWYGTGYARNTVNWLDGTTKETYGEFAGLSYKLPFGKLSLEQQMDNKNGFSVNFGGTINLSSIDNNQRILIQQDNSPELVNYDD